MKFNLTTESWGDIISITNDNASACLYWYHDDPTTIYLANLNVDSEVRNKGVGTKLQEICEEIGMLLGAKYACLWVEKNAWMHEWYKRRGYTDYKDHEKENYIWMNKTL